LSNFTNQKKTVKQGVALMGRNTTGPPCSVIVRLLDWRRHYVIA